MRLGDRLKKLDGEPVTVVCTPRDAIEAFFSTPLDALVIGSFIVRKGGGQRT